MDPNELAKLVEQANAMVSATQGSDYCIQRGVQQLSDTSRRLAGRAAGAVAPSPLDAASPDASAAASDDAARTKAHYFLSKHSIDPSRITKALHSINLRKTAFQPTGPVVETDVDGYLRQQHQMAVQSVIDDARSDTEELYAKHCSEVMQASWASAKRDLLETWGIQAGPSASPSPAARIPQTPSRQQQQQRSSLSAAAAPGTPAAQRAPQTPALGSPGAAAGASVAVDQRTAAYSVAVETYVRQRTSRDRAAPGTARPISVLPLFAKAAADVEEREMTERKRMMADNWGLLRFMLGDAEDGAGGRTQEEMVAGALRFLHEQFMEVVREAVRRDQTTAAVGGAPDSAELVRGFIRARRVPQTQAMWAAVFYCLRCGLVPEALASSQAIRGDRAADDVASALQSVQASGRVTRELEGRLAAELQRCRRAGAVDPYKATVLNYLSREDWAVQGEAFQQAVCSIQDYLWMRLSMLEPAGPRAAPAGQRSRPTLAMLQGEMRQFHTGGGDAAAAASKNPLCDFQVLALTLQFERAVERLVCEQQFAVEGVHFAVALFLKRALRAPAKVQDPLSADVFVMEGESLCVNVPRLLWQWTQKFINDPRRVFVYYGVLEQGLAQRCLTTYLLDFPDIDGLLQSDLLVTFFPRDAVGQAVISAARDSEASGKYERAIVFYKHAQSMAKVLQIASSLLGRYMSQRSNPAREQVNALAVELARRQDLKNVPGWNNFYYVAKLADWFDYFHQGRYQEAVNLIADMGLIPTTNDATEVTNKAEAVRSLPREVVQNLGDIILAVMTCLQKLYEQHRGVLARTRDQNTYEMMRQIQMKARALITFAVCPLEYKISPEQMTALNQMELSMN
eukprot:m51a1_g4994 putative nuclear pore complex protein (854) ;mRNA; f:106537-110431